MIHDKTTIRVDIFSDVICPWCYIGRKRLEEAAILHQKVVLDIHWRAFILNPQIPPEGMDRKAYLQAKFGANADNFYGQIAEVGRHIGIDFNFDAITRVPDSKPPLTLIKAAGDNADAVLKILFKAYFIDGIDIGDEAFLNRLAERFSISADDLATAETLIEIDLEEVVRMSIRGVPHIIIDNEWAINGAHMPTTFLPIFDVAIARRQHA